jgi:hypothetical protein
VNDDYLADEYYRDLYLSTININLPRYFNRLKDLGKDSNCNDDILLLIENLSDNNLIPHSILKDIESYGDIFNTNIMDFDDIKVIIFVLNFIAKIAPDDCVKKYCLLASLELAKETIRQEKDFIDKQNSSLSNNCEFIMIDKLINRIKSNEKGFSPKFITYDDIKTYLGEYGMYMLVKTAYYPFQSLSDINYENNIFLYTVIELLKNSVLINTEKIIKALDCISESKRFTYIENQLHQYGTKELQTTLKNRKDRYEQTINQ